MQRVTKTELGHSVGMTISQLEETLRALRLISQEDEASEVNISAAARRAKNEAIKRVEQALCFAQPNPEVCRCGHHKSHHKAACKWHGFDYGNTVCGCKKFVKQGRFVVHRTYLRSERPNRSQS